MRARHGVGHGVELNRQVEIDAVLALEKAKLTPTSAATSGRLHAPPHQPPPPTINRLGNPGNPLPSSQQRHLCTDFHRHRHAAVESAEALFASTAAPFCIGEHQIKLGVSIGVAMFPKDGAAAFVLANAHAALFRAKSGGRGMVCFFDAALDNSIRERHLLLQDLEFALKRGEFLLHYQPQADKTGEIVGFEALLRWIHPTRGFVSPDTFIPIAEESGLIIQIGQWVLEEACREAASWPRPLNIAVNLSPIQFRSGDLPQTVHSILLETGLASNRLELEITEGALVSDFSRATSILRQLKALGARIAMDDFGTGYSSLSYLQAFPFDKIKIDRSFVSGHGNKAQSDAIIRAITGLGRGFGLPVIAEGVETEEQRIFLLNEGCEELQGYLIGRPRSINEYAHFVGRELSQRLSVG
jgi:predicted signal transduction protein with EAL and GGDEF domain